MKSTPLSLLTIIRLKSFRNSSFLFFFTSFFFFCIQSVGWILHYALPFWMMSRLLTVSSHALDPFPRHDQTTHLIIHTYFICLRHQKNPSVTTWFRKSSTDIRQLLCFSDLHLDWQVTFFINYFCSEDPTSCLFVISSSPSMIWSFVSFPRDPSCTSLCLLLCYDFKTSFRTISRYRTFFSASVLLPRPTSSSHRGAYRLTSRWFSFVTKSVMNSINSFHCSRSYSTGHFFQWISLTWLNSIFFTFCGQNILMFFVMSLRSLDEKITSLVHDSSCRTSHLLPHLTSIMYFFFFWYSLLHLSIYASFTQQKMIIVSKFLSISKTFLSLKTDKEFDSSSIVPTSCEQDFNVLSPPHWRKTKTILNNFPIPILIAPDASTLMTSPTPHFYEYFWNFFFK